MIQTSHCFRQWGVFLHRNLCYNIDRYCACPKGKGNTCYLREVRESAEGGGESVSIFSVLISIQYVGIVALMIEILYVIKQKTSRLQTLMLFVLIATCINFVGYLFEMQATDQDMALMAIKFIYFGKPYIALSIFLFAMEFYKVKLPRWLVNLLCAVHISVTILVLTCEKHTLYYSSINYTYEGMFPHLVFGHSIFYIIYNFGFIMGYLLIIAYVGFKNYKYTRDRKSVV